MNDFIESDHDTRRIDTKYRSFVNLDDVIGTENGRHVAGVLTDRRSFIVTFSDDAAHLSVSDPGSTSGFATVATEGLPQDAARAFRYGRRFDHAAYQPVFLWLAEQAGLESRCVRDHEPLTPACQQCPISPTALPGLPPDDSPHPKCRIPGRQGNTTGPTVPVFPTAPGADRNGICLYGCQGARLYPAGWRCDQHKPSNPYAGGVR